MLHALLRKARRVSPQNIVRQVPFTLLLCARPRRALRINACKTKKGKYFSFNV